jgi:multisubunit Na+/H+ antiporter MnhF subunit
MIGFLLLLFIALNPLKTFNVLLRVGPVDWYNVMYVALIVGWILKQDDKWIKHPLNKYFLAFIALLIFSYFRGLVGPNSLDQVENLKALKAIVTEVFLFFAFLNFIYSKRQIRYIIYLTAIVLLIETVVCSQQYFDAIAEFGADFSWNLKSKVTGTFLVGNAGWGTASANEAGSFFSLYILLIWGYAVYCPNRRTRMILFIVGFISIFPMMFTQSRGAWLGFLFSITFYMIRNNKRLLIIFGLLFILAVPFLPESVAERGSGIGDSSAQSRLTFWIEAISAMTNPIYFLFGTGFSQANLYIGMDAHNSFIRIMLESGMLGLIFFVIFTYWIYKYLNFYLQNVEDPIYKGFLLGTVLSFNSFVILNLVGSRLYNGAVAATMWAIMGVAIKIGVMNESYQEDEVIMQEANG